MLLRGGAAPGTRRASPPEGPSDCGGHSELLMVQSRTHAHTHIHTCTHIRSVHRRAWWRAVHRRAHRLWGDSELLSWCRAAHTHTHTCTHYCGMGGSPDGHGESCTHVHAHTSCTHIDTPEQALWSSMLSTGGLTALLGAPISCTIGEVLLFSPDCSSGLSSSPGWLTCPSVAPSVDGPEGPQEVLTRKESKARM